MKTLAYWGSQHPVTTRWVIFFSFVLLNVLCINLAWWAMAHDFLPYPLLLPLSVALGFLGLFLYPVRRWKGTVFSKDNYFRYHKTMDGILVGATLLMVFSGTQYFSVQAVDPPARAITTALDFRPDQPKNIFDKLKDLKNQVKEKVQTHVAKRLNDYEAAKGKMPVWVKILLTVAALAVAFVLWYIIAALACTVACSGNEIAGNIIIIGGTALVVLLLAWVVFQIWKRRGPRPEKIPEPEDR